MGAAASLGKVQQATSDELRTVAEALSAEEREKLGAALAKLPFAQGKEDAFTGVVAAGENEDGVDQALAAELAEQEKLFLKCLRKRAEREAKKKLEKEEKKAAAKKLKEKAMEAAFDNELDDLLKLFEEGVEPECADEHGTTLLSESCAGNAQEVAEMLIGEGCDPNSVGRYRRTPLWRAAYAGNHELIRQLLRSGGDPRECDEQGARPIDVASNAQSREYLVCWDPASTDRIKEDKRKAAKNAEKEEKAKFKRQQKELVDSLEESERRAQVSKSELARGRKLLADYRQQKVSFVEQGAAEKLAELEPLIESAEMQVKLFEGSVQEWEWKASRAKLKMNDLEQAKKEKEAKAAGKLRGFKVQIVCATLEELEATLPRLSKDLEVTEDFTWNDIDLVKGDSLIKDGVFNHLKASEFNMKFLETYGKPSAEEEAETSPEEGVEKEEPFPVTLNFSRGFNRTVPIKAIADVLLKDVGGLRAQDGRWPFVIDPSGRTSTFIKYSGAAVFTIVELQDMDTLRLRRAFLNCLLHGGALLVDLGGFDTKIDVVADKFNDLEKGFFAKLLDRAVLYSYMLPRRFKSLIVKEIAQDFQISAFLDDALMKFVFGFVTSYRDPDLDFAKQFYTVSVKGGEEEPEA
mmetsp:Transcript_8016/g.18668  ORF Transcript_8016/g.18668 Transcript_8016/m.18668 type:complete len:634 (+) Transcript_8016:28-1929(+)